MKKTRNSILAILTLMSFATSNAQKKEIKRNWVSFVQSVKVNTNKKIKFKLVSSIKASSEDGQGRAQMWARVDNKHEGYSFFENMNDRPVTTNEWGSYSIEGYIDEQSDKIVFGGLTISNGQFYYDKFELFTQNENGVYEILPIENGSFEILEKDGFPKGWTTGIGKKAEKVKGFSMSSSKDATDGKNSLFIVGEGIEKDTTNLIGPIKGFSPQMGTLVTMLNNLSSRVESIVGNLSQQETDHLLDEKANSIGALIMHLAATEVIYQALTFEDRGFNEEEQKKWGAAMDLGQKGRDSIKGKDIQFYLDEWKKVRVKTIAGLQKRNDQWLAEIAPGSERNNHFSWFHVMEHQSSHLGQILLLRKRLPEFPKDIKVKNEIKD